MKLKNIVKERKEVPHLEGSLESPERVKSLFLSSPYPGDQKFGGQPTGLLYALTVLANRKEREYGSREEVRKDVEVWCPEGTPEFEGSKLERELTDYISTENPRLVGISTFSVSYENALKIRDLVKKISPETVVVFGGVHEDNYVKHYRERGNVDADFVIAGDGAYLIDRLSKLIESNHKASIDGVKEIVQKDEIFKELNGAGIILFNKLNRLEEVSSQSYLSSVQRKSLKLDGLPIMPRYLIKDEDASARQFSIFRDKKTAQVMVGQGCPFGCGFCSEGIKRTWYDEDSPRSGNPARDLSHVEKELEQLKDSGYQAIFFDDSTFFAKSKDYMQGLVGLLQKYDFEWGCQTTQNSVYKMADLLPEMTKSGLKYVYMGIEHYDGHIRDSFGKSIGGGNKFNGHAVEDTLKILYNNGINIGISLTFGHPDPESPEEETRETKTTASYSIDRTSELMSQFPNVMGVSLNLITYHPGTPNSERYERKVGSLDYTAHPNKREPFTNFEEGIGQHPKGMTPELVEHILSYAKQKILGDRLWI